MQKIFLLLFISISLSSFAGSVNLSSIIIPDVYNNQPPPSNEVKKKHTIRLKDVQKLAGRKLTLKEKIAFLLIKRQLRHPEETGKKGNSALILGIIGLTLLVIGFFVPFLFLISILPAILAIVFGNIAKRQDPSDAKARSAVLLGWITLGIFALVLILGVLIIASWGWY